MGVQPNICFEKPSFTGEFTQHLTVPAVGVWFLHFKLCGIRSLDARAAVKRTPAVASQECGCSMLGGMDPIALH